MHLKRLELAGFKTFADRTELEFHPGITAIVGPNGSGKSNLCEAIRWVLGEQNARALRGTRTEDFIFAGSARRRAHGLAQAALVLDNATGRFPLEFSEIAITRRATRGGEGEYLLNGVPCRLRDIQMLFLGTGLGGRSYALIGQGEVEEVLNASPQERRLLLEEAAGLAGYKRRRQESLRRLERAAAHLQRVGDLLAELRARYARLTEQAEAARQHRACTEEARALEVALLADEARRLRQSLQRTAAQVAAAHARLAELQQRVEAARGEAARHQQAREALTHAWEAQQRRLLEAVRAQAAAGSAVDRVEARLAAQRQEGERLRAEAARLAAEMARIDAELAALGRDREVVAQEVGALHSHLEAQRAALRAEEARTESWHRELETLEARRSELEAARQQLAAELAALEARRQVLGRQRTTLSERRNRLQEHLAALEAEEERLQERTAEARMALQRHQERQTALAARTRRLDAERAEVGEKLAAAEARGARLESRLQALEEAAEQLVGYEEGARTLLAAKRADPVRFGSILGALVDHIAVDPRYRPAVEAALGRRLFCLLTAGTEALRDALAYVRADGRGPVSFLPLDRLASRHPGGPLPQVRGVLGGAAGFVSAQGKARTAVDVLLGDVVVVEDLDVALGLMAGGYRGRAVTLHGELVSPDGVISVRGNGNGHASPLARRDASEETRRELEALAGVLGALRTRQEALVQETEEARCQAASLEEERGRLERDLAEAEGALAAIAREQARLPREVGEVTDEMVALAAALDDVGAGADRLRAQDEALQAAAREVETQLAERRRAWEGRAAALAQLQQESEEVRIRLAELEATRQAQAVRQRDLAAEREDLAGRRTQILAEESGAAAEASRLAAELAAAREAHACAAREQAALQGELAVLEQQRQVHEAAAVAAQEAAGRAEEQARAAEAALHRAELRAAQAEAEWAATERRLAESGLVWEQVEETSLPLPREEAWARLEALREMVAALGAVNLRAIQEQEELGGRIDRLTRQVADIEAARAALQQLVDRLDGILRFRFGETFAAVNDEFARLFLRLFEGGSAHLELVQEAPGEDPGLEVVVRLPGKPPRSLAALSGGERVLVALALLFAMLRVHPSPFCVFDEVEAALDDANTRRFTTLLRELAQSTQIIIVTHNKGTMEAADVLYGVTMQEPGVSSILSVRLGEPQVERRSVEPARAAR
ncbi:MAG: chromosome segregation protein SMC [Armatimonadota bacterium]|nr:chromosome segregation protein SMC [Armatimonadota bacterium]